MQSPVPVPLTVLSGFCRLVALLALCPLIARSQTAVWDNGGKTNQWGTAKNWNPNSLPTSSTNAQINATDDNATVSNISLNGNQAANSLIFNNVDDNFSIVNGTGSNTLRLTSRSITRTSGSSGTQTLSFTTLAPQNDWDGGWTWDIGGSGSLTIASNITGGWGTNVKSGNGTLILSGNNAFGGVTNINAGVIVAASNTALGTSAWGNSIASGAALGLQGNISLNEGEFSVTGSGVSGTGAIRNLSGNNSLSAALDLGGNTTVGSDAGTITVSGQVNLGSNTLTVAGAGATDFSGAITSNGAITKTGSGTLTFSGTGANSSGGALAINDGTVVLNKSAGTNAYAGSGITIGDGLGVSSSAVLRLGASNQIADYAGALTINSDGVLQMNNQAESINTLAGTGLVDLGTSGYLTVGANSGSSTFGGSLAGTGTFEKTGSGTLTLTQNLNFTGTFVLAGGTLRLSDISVNLARLDLTGNSVIDFAGASDVLSVGTLNLNGFTLTVTNWANAVDYFYAANWNGAVLNTAGSAPMNQITFSGYGASATHWQGYDHQITPVPEPATYGAVFMLLISLSVGFRRFVKSRATHFCQN